MREGRGGILSRMFGARERPQQAPEDNMPQWVGKSLLTGAFLRANGPILLHFSVYFPFLVLVLVPGAYYGGQVQASKDKWNLCTDCAQVHVSQLSSTSN
jgi:hypothetical protein